MHLLVMCTSLTPATTLFCIDTSGKGSSPYESRILIYLSFVSPLGNLYIGDHYNHRVRKITAATSVISTIAGTGSNAYNGDNGQATSATLYHPIGVAVDASGKFKC